jgi:hypothetical protein
MHHWHYGYLSKSSIIVIGCLSFRSNLLQYYKIKVYILITEHFIRHADDIECDSTVASQ